MQDLRRIAERRASRPKSKPVGSSFETEHQRAKKAVVKQIEELSGSDIHMIAATTEDESGQKKILRVSSGPIMRSLFLVVSNVCANGVFTSPFVQVPVIMRNPIRFL